MLQSQLRFMIFHEDTMKFKDNYLIMLIIFAIFGTLVTIQIRSTVGMQRENAETLDVDRLKSQLESKIKLGEDYKAQIEKLEAQQEAFLKASSVNVANAASKIELDRLKLIAGLTDVTGEGVIVTLNDAESTDAEDKSQYIIHEQDVWNVVNQLRLAGAQAISINNERVIATSELLCAGPTIKVNNNRYAVPFEIKAIGDGAELYSHMKDSEIVNELLSSGKRVTLKTGSDILIPKFSNNINSLISNLEVVDNESKKNK